MKMGVGFDITNWLGLVGGDLAPLGGRGEHHSGWRVGPAGQKALSPIFSLS